MRVARPAGTRYPAPKTPRPTPVSAQLPGDVVDDVLATFVQPQRVRAPDAPHVVFVDGKRVQTIAKKHVWPSRTAALLGLQAHIKTLVHGASYGHAATTPGGLVHPRRPGEVWARPVATPAAIVAQLLQGGRVQILPAGTAPAPAP